MKTLPWLFVAVAFALLGCSTTDSGKSASAVGKPLGAILQASKGQRIEFFDSNWRPVRFVAQGQKGSVSIHNKDETGQDNYAFDENHVIIKHQRSYGADYKSGKWQTAK
jgi:hypothetical protein